MEVHHAPREIATPSLPELQTAPPLLEVRDVCIDYLTETGPVHAVDHVSFTLKRGEVMGLAGESGSGKSTLAFGIARLLRHPAILTQGEVIYYPQRSSSELQQTDLQDEKAVTRQETEPVDVLHLTTRQLQAFRWRELAVVFQSAMNALNPVMRLEAQLGDVLQVHCPKMSSSARRDRIAELLRLVGIAPDRMRSYPHELSGGMRQRAMIAMALALSPQIIIMDEPTTALDVVVQRDILSELLALRRQLNFSVIFITHDLSLLLEIADRVAIMYAGRLVEVARGEDIYEQPRHPYTYGLLHSFPSLYGPRRRMTGIPGSPPDLRAVPSGCPFHPRCRFAFDACPKIVPQLLTISEERHQQVACHLYDSHLHSGDLPEELQTVKQVASIPYNKEREE